MQANESLLKVPPHNIEAEQAVIGGCFLRGDAIDEVAFLKSDEFYRKDHRLIFETILELASKESQFDIVTVADVLDKRHLLEEAGGMRALAELAENTPSASNIKAYADIVHKRALLREIVSACTDITDKVFNPEGKGAYEVADYAASKIYNLADEKIESNLKAAKDVTNSFLEKLDHRFHHQGEIQGLKTGFTDLDSALNGMEGGNLIIVAGRPSMGKTSFAFNIAENLAVKQNKVVAGFSLEMPEQELIQRSVSSLSGVSYTAMKTGRIKDEQWKLITKATGQLSNSNLHIDETAGLSVMQIRSRMRKLQRKQGLDLVVIDYLQLMTHPKADRHDLSVGETTKQLKSMAKEFNIPIILLSQLNRGLEQRQDKRPVMADLRESGAIEQDADVIMFVYRDEVYDDESVDKGKAEIIIRKNRNGATCAVTLTFQGYLMKFDNFIDNQWRATA